jgi:hypothetical protein
MRFAPPSIQILAKCTAARSSRRRQHRSHPSATDGASRQAQTPSADLRYLATAAGQNRADAWERAARTGANRARDHRAQVRTRSCPVTWSHRFDGAGGAGGTPQRSLHEIARLITYTTIVERNMGTLKYS